MAKCIRCGTTTAPRIFGDGLCGCCQISIHGLQLVGMIPRTKGRVDVCNPQVDTLRAIEYMAATNQTSGTNLKRWADHARATLPDKNTKIQPDYDRDPGPRVSQAYQADVRQAEGEMQHLWQNAKYERQVLKRKPTTDIQKRNYDMVDASGDM